MFLKIPQARPQRGREGKQRKKVLCDSLRFDFAELSVSNAMKMNGCKDAAASLIMNCCMIKKKKKEGDYANVFIKRNYSSKAGGNIYSFAIV